MKILKGLIRKAVLRFGLIVGVVAGSASLLFADEFDPGLTFFFEIGGNEGRFYRVSDPRGVVPPFILSEAAPKRMNHADATRFCSARGARLATLEEFLVLARVMSQSGRYRRHSISGMAANELWSSSEFGPTGQVGSSGREREKIIFDGCSGRISEVLEDEFKTVRCVIAARTFGL